jgi:selenocysteine lyase/cysteine desulfurase
MEPAASTVDERDQEQVVTPEKVLQFRKQFPIFGHMVHLATNSRGALSERVIEAHNEYLESWRTRGAPWDTWVEKHEELRASFARLINARVNEVAICFSATQALGMVASALDWQQRPVVVIDDFMFPSIAQLWHAQSRRGAVVRRVPVGPDGFVRGDGFVAAVDSATQLVTTAHICYKNGHRANLEEIGACAHAAGALFAVDDYQSNGSERLNVRASKIDLLTTGTVKFLLGSPGLAFLYVNEDVLDRLHPTLTGWFGQSDPGNFQVESHFEGAGANRFQSGTPAISPIYDSLAGIEVLEAAGLDDVGAWIRTLTTYAVEKLAALGIEIATPHDPALRGPQIAIRSRDGAQAVAELERRGIITSTRDDNIRTAWHYYNTIEDVDVLCDALVELPELLVFTGAHSAHGA